MLHALASVGQAGKRADVTSHKRFEVFMRASIVRNVAALLTVATSQAISQQPTGGATPPQGGAGPGAQAPQGQGAGRGGNNRPRPYNQVITDRAKSDQGGVTVHQV